jgi:hypothetical protein
MTEVLQEFGVQCPYCGETFTTTLDCTITDQDFIEDCEACCQPILLSIHFDSNGELTDAGVLRENE